MNKIVGVTELQRRFKSILDEVVDRGVPYILTRGSRPEAALVPYEEFLRYQELRGTEVLARFDRLLDRMVEQNEQYSQDEVEADVQRAREEVRKP